MSTPEPVDEEPAVPEETRGGDHLTDITVPGYAKGGPVLPMPEGPGCADPECGCGTGD